MTYDEWLTAISKLVVIPTDNADLQAILPSCINDAEQRIYRELDMLVEDVRDSSSTTIAGSRNFTLPTSIGTFQIISEINVITPASTPAEDGTRVSLTPVSLPVLDWIWPSSTGSGVPQQYAYISQGNLGGFSGQANIVFGPWPDDTYTVEVVGKIIPAPLSPTNQTTFLTLYLPDLFIAASMIYMSAYLKNFGAQADDPRQAVSWSQHYADLKASADVWEARKRFSGASWTSKQVEPSAVPQRG